MQSHFKEERKKGEEEGKERKRRRKEGRKGERKRGKGRKLASSMLGLLLDIQRWD